MKLIDLHCDTMVHLMEGEQVLLKNELGVDIHKLQAGHSLAQFFALFIDMNKWNDPLHRCLAMVDRFYQELEKNQEYIALATNYEDVLRNQQMNKLSAFLTIEEGGALAGKLSNLRNFYRLGVRLITLIWNYPNEIGYPNAGGVHSDQGLTEFGRNVVAEMNRLGMLIDVSHMSDKGFYDVARLSEKPFVASHSNARTITGHLRNMTDDMIRLLSEKGGIMGITFPKQFLGTKDISLVEDMIIHIKHIKQIGGIDVLAIGTDLDGTKPKLEIDNIGSIGKLLHGLEQAGFSTTELEKIFHKNALRVIKEVL